jgi:hypothetical protein
VIGPARADVAQLALSEAEVELVEHIHSPSSSYPDITSGLALRDPVVLYRAHLAQLVEQLHGKE